MELLPYLIGSIVRSDLSNFVGDPYASSESFDYFYPFIDESNWGFARISSGVLVGDDF